MSIYSSGNNDSNKAINLYNDLKKNTQDLFISEDTTKTVGSGKDFETLHEALRWVEGLIFVNFGFITLTLDDGIHIIGGEDEFDDWEWTYYYFKNSYIIIQSASGIKDNCIIALDGFDDGDNFPAIFAFAASRLTIAQVTIDMKADGYPYDNAELCYTHIGTFIMLNNTIFKNGLLGIYQKCLGWIFNSTIDSGELTYATSSDGKLYNSTFQNCNKAIVVNTQSSVQSQGSTFTNNTTDINIPLNEIQYDQSCISDGTGPISFKA